MPIRPLNIISLNQIIRLVLLLICIVSFNIIPTSNLFTAAVKDWGHAVVFFLSSSFLFSMLRALLVKDKTIQIIPLASLSLAALTVGGMIELVQPYFHRSRSIVDFYYDALGIALAALLFTSHYQQNINKNLLRTLALGLISCSMILPSYLGWVLLSRAAALPTLLSFEKSWESRLWRTNRHTHAERELRPSDHASESNRYWLKLRLLGGRFPGIAFDNIYPDWKDYHSLNFSIYSEAETVIKLSLRVNDDKHNNRYTDRFNRSVDIKPGNNTYTIAIDDIKTAPSSRELNISRIRNLTLFVASPDSPTTLYLDDFRLR